MQFFGVFLFSVTILLLLQCDGSSASPLKFLKQLVDSGIGKTPVNYVGPELPENPPEWMLNLPKLSDKSLIYKDFPEEREAGDNNVRLIERGDLKKFQEINVYVSERFNEIVGGENQRWRVRYMRDIIDPRDDRMPARFKKALIEIYNQKLSQTSDKSKQSKRQIAYDSVEPASDIMIYLYHRRLVQLETPKWILNILSKWHKQSPLLLIQYLHGQADQYREDNRDFLLEDLKWNIQHSLDRLNKFETPLILPEVGENY